MACGSCGTGGCGTKTGGCNSNGGCATGGCNKLNTYDWLGNMMPPGQTEADNIYEVRFKNTRKAFYKNVNGLNLITGDFVAVESDRGFDVGQISLGGVLAKLQMKKKGVKDRPDQVQRIYRRATKEDQEKLRTARAREQAALVLTRQIIKDLRLDMKCSDVEFQGDNTKAIFHYIADERVDFRQLIKILAQEFHIRVEMKQIGLRHESGLVGAIGSCGRELCCSTWLTDFRNVSTSAARYQNLSLNPMKISGQCGRLKCCLNYELESYMDALKYIPEIRSIDTMQGRAFLQKTDIFKQIMWFAFEQEANWVPVPVKLVNEMKAMNDAGTKPMSLHSLDGTEPVQTGDEEMDFVDVVGQSKLRENTHRNKDRNRDRNERRPQNLRREEPPVGDNTPSEDSPSALKEEGAPQEQQPRREGSQNPQRREGGPQNRQQGGQGQDRNRDNRNNRNQDRNRENRNNQNRGDRRPPQNNNPANPEEPGAEGQQRPERRDGGPQNQQRRNNDRNRGGRNNPRGGEGRNRPPQNRPEGGNDNPPPPANPE